MSLVTVFPRIIAVPRLIPPRPFDGNIQSNRLPRIITHPHLPSLSSRPFIPSLSSSSAVWSSITDQWRFKIWIKELNLEHWKSPCSVCLMSLVFYLMAKKKKQKFRARLPVSNIWNNGLPRIIAFPRIIVPGYYSKKYGRLHYILLLT